MGTTVLMVLVLFGSLTLPGAVGRAQRDPPAALGKLKILYAGYADGSREKAWVGFLEKWFEKVDSIRLEKLNAASAADYDVVVADWTARYKDGSYNSKGPKHGTSLSTSFGKPIIMVSAVAAELTRSMKLKTDWL